MSLSSTILALSPGGYYKFDETSGTSAADSSGNSRGAFGHASGVTVNQASLLGDGSGKAVNYNGSSGYSTMAYAAWMAIGSPGFTIFCRIKPASGVLSAAGFIASRWQSGGDTVWLQSITNTAKLGGSVRCGGAQYDVVGATALTAATQYSAGLRWDSATNKFSVWRNGIKDGEVTTAGAISTSTGLLDLARAAGTTGAGLSYGGDLDEWAYWPAASLSDADMLALHNAAVAGGSLTGTPSDPVGVSDSIVLLGTYDRTVGDNVSVTDVAVGGADEAVTIGDAVGVLDLATPVITFDASQLIDDSVGVADTATPVLVSGGIGVTVGDPVGITDSVDIVTHQPGSVWSPYAVSDSGTQSLDFSIVPDSPEYPWPFAWEGDGYSNSLWLVFTAADTQVLTLTLTSSFDAGIEVWSGDVIDDPENDLSIVGYGQGTLEVPIAAGETIRMRAHPLLLSETGTGSLNWSVAARTETGVLGFVAQAEILETPGWLDVSLLSATPDADVTFALDGGSTFFTVHTEIDGTYEGSVLLPDLTVGVHSITATDSDGQTETESFTVLLEPQAPDSIPGSTPPTTGISTDPVPPWVLEDPAPSGLGNYVFPINPSEMSSPWPLKNIRVEHTIHGSGQDILWEGRAEPVSWTLKGSVMTQEFYEMLEAYSQLNRRLYVVDHHQRGWVVAFESIAWEKKGPPGNDWFYAYTAKFLILGGPVSLT